jgi:Sec-independent protein translocase protein TatA
VRKRERERERAREGYISQYLNQSDGGAQRRRKVVQQRHLTQSTANHQPQRTQQRLTHTTGLITIIIIITIIIVVVDVREEAREAAGAQCGARARRRAEMRQQQQRWRRRIASTDDKDNTIRTEVRLCAIACVFRRPRAYLSLHGSTPTHSISAARRSTSC